MFNRKEIICRTSGALSGLLMALPNIYPDFAVVQIVCLIPILLCLTRWQFKRAVLLLSGMYMALAYTMPQVAFLRLPLPVTLILIIDFVVIMMLLVWIASKLVKHPTVLNCLALGAFVVVLDWANYTAVPLWGTAQSIARSWSSWPQAIAFTSVTGMAGIVFVVVTFQACAVTAIIHPATRRHMAIAAISVFVTAGLINLIAAPGSPDKTLKVAAIGWNSAETGNKYDPQRENGFEILFAQPVAQAAKAGARLIVSPEMGFYVDQYDMENWINKIRHLAIANQVYLAVGYLDAGTNENRMMFVSPQGLLLNNYTKTYLTVFENSNKGDGKPKMIEIDGIKVGGMICQDDNFTSISRRYGRRSTELMAVPTLDWKTVRSPHMQNSIHRAIESRYGIVRAAFDGISAIISPKGKVLASFDHIENGPGWIDAEIEIYTSPPTLFSLLGNWFVLVNAIFFCVYRITARHYNTQKAVSEIEIAA